MRLKFKVTSGLVHNIASFDTPSYPFHQALALPMGSLSPHLIISVMYYDSSFVRYCRVFDTYPTGISRAVVSIRSLSSTADMNRLTVVAPENVIGLFKSEADTPKHRRQSAVETAFMGMSQG